MVTSETVSLRADDFPEEGLYLFFSDGNRLILTQETIEQFSSQFLGNPVKVPTAVKKAIDFQACSICPKKDTGEFCHALRPGLPFLDVIDKYDSISRVVAVYKNHDKALLYVSFTDMQKALQYLSILSLMYYCEVGRQYWKYFTGIIPLMETTKIVQRIYLNLYWDCQGDKQLIKEIIKKFQEEIFITTSCQVKRLSCICKNDALANALVLTHAITDLLSLNYDEMFQKSSDEFTKNQ